MPPRCPSFFPECTAQPWSGGLGPRAVSASSCSRVETNPRLEWVRQWRRRPRRSTRQDETMESVFCGSNVMPNQLEQLRQLSTVVADTGDIDAIGRFRPQDATTNPSLLLKAVSLPAYAEVIDGALSA